MGVDLERALGCAGVVTWECDLPSRRVDGAPWTLLGYRPDQIAATMEGWNALRHPDQARQADAALAAHLAGTSPHFSASFQVRAADGAWRWILASAAVSARAPDGVPLALSGAFIDVTEFRRLQDAAQAEERLEAVGTLAAGVAHEVNNPLACVASNAAYVEEALARLQAGEALPPVGELRQALREALEGVDRVKGIIHGLRQFAEPVGAGPRTRTDVGAQILAAVSQAQAEVSRRARLVVDAPDLPPVLATEQELVQVLVNLLENAALAIPDGAAGSHEIAVIGRAEGDRVVIEVRDTGAGIAPDALPRIFDPFFTTRPVGHGTGLGLAVCHGIVTALGGRIEVESTPGQGARFRVSLPAAGPVDEPQPEPLRAAPRAVAGPGRVLVVEDEPLFGRSVARLLAGGATVESAADLAEALARIRAGDRWDVILCDLASVGADAASVEDRVAAEAPDLLPAIVYLTDGAGGPAPGAALPRYACFLEKPIDPAALRVLFAERVPGRATDAPERAAG